MNSLLHTVANGIDKITELIGRMVMGLSGILVLVVCYDVITRYLFRSTSVAILELEWHLFATLLLLGAAMTLKHDRHVRVDVLYQYASLRGKAWINLIGILVFLLPFCGYCVYTSCEFAWVSFRIKEGSPDPGGLPARYLLKAMLTVAFSLLFVQGISCAIRSYFVVSESTEKTEIN